MGRISKQETILRIIAEAYEYNERPMSSDDGRIAYLCKFIAAVTRGTRYEGDGHEIIDILTSR